MPKGMVPQIKHIKSNPSHLSFIKYHSFTHGSDVHVRLRLFHSIMIDLSTAFLLSPILHHLRYKLGGACSILAAVKTWAQGGKHFGQALVLTRCLERHDKSFLINELDFVRK